VVLPPQARYIERCGGLSIFVKYVLPTMKRKESSKNKKTTVSFANLKQCRQN
jgi:hypothetical protein